MGRLIAYPDDDKLRQAKTAINATLHTSMRNEKIEDKKLRVKHYLHLIFQKLNMMSSPSDRGEYIGGQPITILVATEEQRST